MKLAQTHLSGLVQGGMAVAPASWTAPALWRFGHASHALEKRQRTAAVQNLAEFRAVPSLSRRDSVKIARRFNAGNGLNFAPSPGGTTEIARTILPSLRDLNCFVTQPGVKTPGYYRSSLRDKNSGARLWSQTQPQRVASTRQVGIFVSAAAGAAHTAAFQTKAARN